MLRGDEMANIAALGVLLALFAGGIVRLVVFRPPEKRPVSLIAMLVAGMVVSEFLLLARLFPP